MGDHPEAAHRRPRAVLRMVHRLRVSRHHGTSTGSASGELLGLGGRGAAGSALRAAAAEPGQVRHVRARCGIRRRRRHPRRLTDIRAMGLGRARRPHPSVGVHQRGLGARFPSAVRRFDGDVSLLIRVRSGPRAHHPGHRSGARHPIGPEPITYCPTATPMRRRSKRSRPQDCFRHGKTPRRSSRTCAAARRRLCATGAQFRAISRPPRMAQRVSRRIPSLVCVPLTASLTAFLMSATASRSGPARCLPPVPLSEADFPGTAMNEFFTLCLLLAGRGQHRRRPRDLEVDRNRTSELEAADSKRCRRPRPSRANRPCLSSMATVGCLGEV